MQQAGKKSRLNWLLAGVITGAGLAATGLVEDQLSPIDDTTLATIDGESISLAHYTSVLEALQKDSGKPLLATDQTHLLERMIDEKLLLQHAEHLGLTRTDSAVKKAIVDAVIENIISENRGLSPATKDLESFYARNRAYFSHPPLFRVQRMVFSGADAEQRAQRAHTSLSGGETFANIQQSLANDDILALPSSLIPQNRLSNYLGPRLSKAVSELEPGQFTRPTPIGGSFVLLALIEKVSGETPPLEAIRDQVTREYQRRQNDQALRDYLEVLKTSADIRINKALMLDVDARSASE